MAVEAPATTPTQQPNLPQPPNVNDKPQKTFSDLFMQPNMAKHSRPSIPVKNPNQYRGKPAVFFSENDVSTLSAPLRFTLVGKFSHGRPPIADIRSALDAIGVKGSHVTGVIDHKHISMIFSLEEDFHKIWCKEQWYIKKYPMRVFKWSPDFSIHHESPLVPIWVNLPTLPLHLYNKAALFSIGNNLGTPMRVDQATMALNRPSIARICIEIDISDPLPNSIWIGSEEEKDTGYWQEIMYEKIPPYCTSCFKLGHDDASCFIIHPAKAPSNHKNHTTPHAAGFE